MTRAAVVDGKSEIQAYRFGVPEMEIPVRLRWKTRAYARRVERARTLHGGGAGMARPVACREFTGSQVRFDHLPDEVRHRRLGLRRRRTFGAIACIGLRHADAILRYAASWASTNRSCRQTEPALSADHPPFML